MGISGYIKIKSMVRWSKRKVLIILFEGSQAILNEPSVIYE